VAADHENLIIATSELPYPELQHLRGFQGLHIDRLSSEVAIRLLRANGVIGEPSALEQIVADWDGHPQALTAVAIYLKSKHHGLAFAGINLPAMAEDASFEARLQAIGEAIQDRRTPAERLALEVLSLARGPLEVSVLIDVMRKLHASEWSSYPPVGLDNLFASEAVRHSSAGLLPHPVLRNLYRTRTRSRSAAVVNAVHRLLANHYYAPAIDADYDKIPGPGDSRPDNNFSAKT
jgi:hypothetical protein